MEKRDAEELKEAAWALVEYLRKKQTPMTTAIVTGAGVEILSTEIHVPFEEELRRVEKRGEESGRHRTFDSGV